MKLAKYLYDNGFCKTADNNLTDFQNEFINIFKNRTVQNKIIWTDRGSSKKINYQTLMLLLLKLVKTPLEIHTAKEVYDSIFPFIFDMEGSSPKFPSFESGWSTVKNIKSSQLKPGRKLLIIKIVELAKQH